MNRSLVAALASLAAAVILVLVVWMHVRPKMEAAAIDERARALRATISYSAGLAEGMLHDQFTTVALSGRTIKERPREGEQYLRSILDQHADLLAARVNSPGSSDELLVARTHFVVDSTTFAGSGWFAWDEDTSVVGSIAARSGEAILIRIQTRLFLDQNDYILTTVWDGRSFEHLFSSFPLEPSALMHMLGPSGIIWKSWKADSVGLEPRDRLTERFAKFPLTLVVAFPSDGVTMPVRAAIRDSLITGLILILVPGVVGYWMRKK